VAVNPEDQRLKRDCIYVPSGAFFANFAFADLLVFAF
jgi:hypothetical protein